MYQMIVELKEIIRQDQARKKLCLLILVSAAAESVLFAFYGFWWTETIRRVILISALIVIGRIDYLKRIIPNLVLLVLVVVQAVLLTVEWAAGRAGIAEIFMPPVAGGAMTLGLFLLVRVFSKGGIGMGDIKLCAVLGFYLGSSLILVDLIVCFGFSAIYSIVQIIRKKLSIKGQIPFAPFICIGTTLLLLIGF